jgi:hypothetical protein
LDSNRLTVFSSLYVQGFLAFQIDPNMHRSVDCGIPFCPLANHQRYISVAHKRAEAQDSAIRKHSEIFQACLCSNQPLMQQMIEIITLENAKCLGLQSGIHCCDDAKLCAFEEWRKVQATFLYSDQLHVAVGDEDENVPDRTATHPTEKVSLGLKDCFERSVSGLEEEKYVSEGEDFEWDIFDTAYGSEMYSVFQKIARRYTGKLFKTLIRREPRFDRRAISKTLRALGRIWDSGLGRAAAVDIVRHTLSAQEDEARVLGLNLDDLAAFEEVLFDRAEEATPWPVWDEKVLRVLRKCSVRLFARLKRSLPRWNRASILRALSLLAGMWEGGLGRAAALDAVGDTLADREEEALAVGVDPSDPDDMARLLFSPEHPAGPCGLMV